MTTRRLSAEAEQRIKARELQRRLDSYHAAATVIPLAYLEALAALAHIAIHGIRRPDDLGGHITGVVAGSTGCRELHPASKALHRAVQTLIDEADRLDKIIDSYDEALAGEGDGTSQSVGAA